MPINDYADNAIHYATADDLAGFGGLENFAHGHCPLKSTTVLDSSECIIFIGGNGVIIEAKDGYWFLDFQELMPSPHHAIWVLMNVMVLCYDKCGGTYTSAMLKHASWEYATYA